MKGIAPGKAPTKTDNEVTDFKGVYTQVYKNIDIAPKNAVLKLMYCKIKIPKRAKTVAIVAATILLILPLGKGLF
tara:strand:- start:20 stop:244 length:225 start_codon:yes stop_codon:yes gene_type:complete